MALCKTMIIGNLGSDPEMRYTPNGRAVTQFNVAVNQSTKNQQTGEWVEETDWFRVTIWGDRAERMAENLRKGNKVFVEGRFRTPAQLHGNHPTEQRAAAGGHLPPGDRVPGIELESRVVHRLHPRVCDEKARHVARVLAVAAHSVR